MNVANQTDEGNFFQRATQFTDGLKNYNEINEVPKQIAKEKKDKKLKKTAERKIKIRKAKSKVAKNLEKSGNFGRDNEDCKD